MQAFRQLTPTIVLGICVPLALPSMAQARLTDLVSARQGDARTAQPDAFGRNQSTDRVAGALGSPSADSPDSLVLEVDGACPDDADPDTPGHQIEVELWMRDLTQDVTGFQAFLRFNPELLTFVSGTYTDTPFDQHIPATITASGSSIDVSGSQSAGSTPTSDDALLATLVFTVVDECGSTQVSFRNPAGPFVSELSYQGMPVTTTLIDTPLFGLDDTPPALTGCPSDTSVECDAVPPPATVTATDNCDGALTVDYSEIRTDGSCPDTYTLTRTWTATDACGNSSSCMQTIQVEDTTAPVLSGCPVDDVISCDEPVPTPADVTATDNCDDDVPIVFTEVREDGECPQEYTLTRTWTATDDCGNESSCSQVITVVDTEAPVLSGCPADDTVECDAVPTPAVLTATDNCDDDVTIAFDEVRTDGPCSGEYTLTRTWTATDDCGNESSCVQVITVVDTTPPALTGCPTDETVECDAVPAPPVVTAADACGGPVTLDFEEVRTDGPCPDSYTLTRTWTATDDCGNASSCSQVVTVEDTTPPEFLDCPPDETVECDAVPAVPTPTVVDNCDDDITVVFDEVREDGPCPDSYTLTRTWTATDDCGNSSNCVQVITVEDTTPPAITGLTATGGEVDGDCEFVVDFSASVSDNCCINEEDVVVDVALPSENATLGPPSVTLSPNGSNGYDITGSVLVSDLTSCPATVQVTVFVTDCCGDPAGALATTPDAGRWSESFAGGAGGAPGNVVHAWSDSDGAQWELSGPTLDNVVLVSDTVVGGEGERVYRTEYFGGQLDVTDSLWGGSTGMVTADVVKHVHVTHQIWTGGVVDWAASWTDIVTDAVLNYDRGLIVAGRATFDGQGASVPSGYPPYLGEASFGGHWGSIHGVTLTSVDLALADVLDSTPPVVTGCPADITVNADAGGCTAVVSWTSPGATDNCGLLDVSFTHEPGDVFGPGATPVTYTFTDGCGNESLCTFNVTVEAVNNVTATIELENVYPGAGGAPDPLQRCMKIVARNTTDGTCASDVHLWVDFTPGTGGVATATVPFEVDCGDWDALCVKDEQHTLYASTGLTSAGPDYAAAATLILPAGDTDNDSDVDIHDVTWLMYQWSLGSGPAAFGDCPWDGTRDADFNNDDILDTTDYGILSGNWLTWSTCPCTVMAGDPVEPEAAWSVGIEQLPPHVGAAVDFNGDGVVDYEDVEVFENANGLSNALSSQLRAATPAKESPGVNLSGDQ